MFTAVDECDFQKFASSRKNIPVSFRYSLTTLTGDDWKRVRSTLAPTFTAKKMKTVAIALGFLKSIAESKLKHSKLKTRIKSGGSFRLQMSPKINNIIDLFLSIMEEKCSANEITDIYG